MAVKQIGPHELNQRLQMGEDIRLIDVREPFERDIASIGGDLLPLGTIPQQLASIPRHGTVVVYCRSGGRSEYAIEYLQSQGYGNLINLEGGILAWADTVDQKMKKY